MCDRERAWARRIFDVFGDEAGGCAGDVVIAGHLDVGVRPPQPLLEGGALKNHLWIDSGIKRGDWEHAAQRGADGGPAAGLAEVPVRHVGDEEVW